MAIPATPLSCAASETALHRLTAHLNADLEQVNILILQESQNPVPLISDLARHLIAAGGKRIRPLLTLACAKAFQDCTPAHIQLATAVEFIHTATLLHDDVVDDSHLRRGRKTANRVWGNEASVLVGDFLFSKAFKLMVSAESLKALDVLSTASAIIAQGEVKQLLVSGDVRVSAKTYFEIIEAKTAALFKAACQVSPLILQQPTPVCQSLGQYGYHLGMIFQIMDDLLDYFGTASTMGKSIGDDFKEGKVTLPLIYLYEKASEKEKSFIKKCFGEDPPAPHDFSSLKELMKDYEIYGQCLQMAQGHGLRAKAALDAAPHSPLITLLSDLVDYCLGRVS